jgi:copper chaperone CopZ
MKKEILSVTGMACDACGARITRALTALSGVETVDVARAAASVTVVYDERVVKSAELRTAVEAVGYGVDGATIQHIHHSDGACCCGTRRAAASSSAVPRSFP